MLIVVEDCSSFLCIINQNWQYRYGTLLICSQQKQFWIWGLKNLIFDRGFLEEALKRDTRNSLSSPQISQLSTTINSSLIYRLKLTVKWQTAVLLSVGVFEPPVRNNHWWLEKLHRRLVLLMPPYSHLWKQRVSHSF